MPSTAEPEAAVVIDVLRATTTIAWALHNGAEAVQAFADLDDLKAAAQAWPAEKRLLLGERGGQKLVGFDLGNSPVAVTKAVVQGKRLFMSTTNGTRALDRVRAVPLLLTAALPNRGAVAQRLMDRQPATLAIVGSGWEGSYSLEDSLAAGALVECLQQIGGATVVTVHDYSRGEWGPKSSVPSAEAISAESWNPFVPSAIWR